MKKILALGFVLLAITACVSIGVKGEDGKPGQDGQSGRLERPYEILAEGTNGGRATESREVIKSQQQLANIYKELGLETAPKVDFTKNNVVALFMGQKNTGGYSIGIDNVAVNGDTAVITVKMASPDGMATMAITNPYCIATVAKTDKVVVK
jgi:hypothetical protein